MLGVRRLVEEPEAMPLSSCLWIDTLKFGDSSGPCDREDDRRGDLRPTKL